MLLAISIHDISENWKADRIKNIFFIVTVLLIGGFGVKDIMAANYAMSQYAYKDKVQSRITGNLPAGVTVMGPPLYYLSLMDNRNSFISYMFLEERCPDFEVEIRAHKVEYIIVDDSLEYMARLWCSDSYYEDQIVKFLTEKAFRAKILDIGYPNSRTPTRMVNRAYLHRVKP